MAGAGTSRWTRDRGTDRRRRKGGTAAPRGEGPSSGRPLPREQDLTDAREQGQRGHVPDQHVPGPGSRGDVRSAGAAAAGLRQVMARPAPSLPSS